MRPAPSPSPRVLRRRPSKIFSTRASAYARFVNHLRVPPPPPSPLARLQDKPAPPGRDAFYEDVSAIFKLPNGGTFYIGNIRAAQSAQTLAKHRIANVINAQDVDTENFHEHDPAFTYLRFPIAHWWSAPDINTTAGVLAFYRPLFAFVKEKLGKGENVMVHCLAGAHRAGTSGVSCVMYFLGLGAVDAVKYVKERRPIVDPIGGFPDLLSRLDLALRERR